jgi:uncharacterized glyoxalase superfamily protein PhnB
MATPAVMLIITVDSVERTRDFYVDTLGFGQAMGMVGKDGQLQFVTVAKEGLRIMLTRGAPGGGTPRPGRQPVEIYAQVKDVQAYHDELHERGVRASDPLTLQWWGDRTFKVLDPNGYMLWFYTNEADPRPPQGSKLI